MEGGAKNKQQVSIWFYLKVSGGRQKSKKTWGELSLANGKLMNNKGG